MFLFVLLDILNRSKENKFCWSWDLFLFNFYCHVNWLLPFVSENGWVSAQVIMNFFFHFLNFVVVVGNLGVSYFCFPYSTTRRQLSAPIPAKDWASVRACSSYLKSHFVKKIG